MKVVLVVGARPQFIKAAPLHRALCQAGSQSYLLHTGQHYDHGMSEIFFRELELPEADVNLDVRSGSHAQQTGAMLVGIESILLYEKPDWTLVFGDTNSTLAGALAAVKVHLPVAHVEAGLRSFNRLMPEEHNRVLTDHCSNLLFCPTQTGVDNLAREGITHGVHLVGDPMYDAVLMFADLARSKSHILEDLRLQPKAYLLATIHRAYNTDDAQALRSIFSAFAQISEKIVLPLHPRTRHALAEIVLEAPANVLVIEPVGYLDMLMLEQNARLVITDSGGMQKEAYFFGVPCVTLRPETEWVETVQAGWNVVVGTDPQHILAAVQSHTVPDDAKPVDAFGDGQAAQKIVAVLQGLPGQ
jgi:UDP-N-acetylglucosamine 2-epimerase